MLLQKSDICVSDTLRITKHVYGRDIANNPYGSRIVGIVTVEAAKEIAKAFVTFEEEVDYEISIYINKARFPLSS